MTDFGRDPQQKAANEREAQMPAGQKPSVFENAPERDVVASKPVQKPAPDQENDLDRAEDAGREGGSR